MRVLLLSEANSIHTRRWVEALCRRNIDIMLLSLSKPRDDFYDSLGVKCIYINEAKFDAPTISKIGYLKLIKHVKRAVSEFRPHILHAHFASSYGFIGSLAGFHPFIVSVWGSDVYAFPNQNPVNKWIIKYVLRKADVLLSTSSVMAKETLKYTNKEIFVTPFGVDTNRFMNTGPGVPKGKFVVGNVKTLAPKYGIDVLIKAYKLVVERNRNLDSELLIYGTGPCREEYGLLAERLGIADKVKFMGYVDNAKLPEVYSSVSVSVSVSVSDSESFGVVAVEAMACECPVITSDADGFTEVVENGVTGLIVPKRNIEATADAIQRFIDDPSLRSKMGTEGRKRVLRFFDWEKNVDTMYKLYDKTLELYSTSQLENLPNSW